MPRVEDIEEFNQDLIRTGKEPEIARQKGEEIEPVLSPKEYPMDNLGPLTKARRATPTPAAAAQATPSSPSNSSAQPSPDSAVSTDDFLASLDTPSPDATAAQTPSPSLDDLFDTGTTPSTNADTSDLFDDELLSGITKSAEPPADLFDLEAATPVDDATAEPDILSDLDDLSTPDKTPDKDTLGDFNLDDPFKNLGDDLDKSLDDIPVQASPRRPTTEPDNAPASTEEPAAVAEVMPDSVDQDNFPEDIPQDAEQDVEAPEPESADMDSFLDNFEAGLGDAAEPDTSTENIELPDFDEDVSSVAPEENATDSEPEDEAFNFDTNDFNIDTPTDSPTPAASEEPNLADELGIDDFGSFDDAVSDFSSTEPKPAEPTAPAEASTDNPFATPDAPTPDMPPNLDTDFGTDDFPEEFSMGDFGKEFGVMEETPAQSWKAPDIPETKEEEQVAEAHRATTADEAKNYTISDADYRAIRETLGSMPLNLKIATEDVLGNQTKAFADIKPIIEALIAGDSPQEIAPLVSKVFGKTIKIPPGYQKKTGRAFEREQASFAYQFRENILPIIRTAVIAFVGLAALVFVAWKFIVIPVFANMKYDRGLEAISMGEYADGNRLFDEAYKEYPVNDRFIQYADAFQKKKEFVLARNKYTDLLGDIDPRVIPPAFPENLRDKYVDLYARTWDNGRSRFKEPWKFGKDRFHKQGLLKYALFCAYVDQDHERATVYLERLLSGEPGHSGNRADHEAATLQGDLFLAWARKIEDPSVPAPSEKFLEETEFYTSEPLVQGPDSDTIEKTDKQNNMQKALFESARLDYTGLIAKEGPTDFLLSKMLRYFIRTGNTEEVEKLQRNFLSKQHLKPDPEAIAELSGILIDKAQGSLRLIDEAKKLAVKTLDEGAVDPALYYQIARANRFDNDSQKEETLLNGAIASYRKIENDVHPLDRWELQNYIDSMIRKAETAWNQHKVMDAQENVNEAIKRYEQGVLSRILPTRSGMFGRAYALRGDISYYDAADYSQAKANYLQAIANQYGVDPNGQTSYNRPALSEAERWEAFQDVSYKLGYIDYAQGSSIENTGTQNTKLLMEAMQYFQDAKGRRATDNLNLRYALAGTSAQLGNYENAISGYRQIYEQLELQRKGLYPYLPRDNRTANDNLELRINVANNLGVSLVRLAQTGGPQARDYLSQARYYLATASELVQNRDRDIDTGKKSQAVPIPFHNMSALLAPAPDNATFLYRPLFKDMHVGNMAEL